MSRRISTWDVPDTKEIIDGYNWKQVADVSAENIQFLINVINDLGREVDEIKERLGMVDEEQAKSRSVAIRAIRHTGIERKCL